MIMHIEDRKTVSATKNIGEQRQWSEKIESETVIPFCSLNICPRGGLANVRKSIADLYVYLVSPRDSATMPSFPVAIFCQFHSQMGLFCLLDKILYRSDRLHFVRQVRCRVILYRLQFRELLLLVFVGKNGNISYDALFGDNKPSATVVLINTLCIIANLRSILSRGFQK